MKYVCVLELLEVALGLDTNFEIDVVTVFLVLDSHPFSNLAFGITSLRACGEREWVGEILVVAIPVSRTFTACLPFLVFHIILTKFQLVKNERNLFKNPFIPNVFFFKR